jgi:hypothetical protein
MIGSSADASNAPMTVYFGNHSKNLLWVAL